jgi:hypothetical protein
MLCHNTDRVPCGIFDNDGNADNLMCTGGGLVPIDNTVTSFNVSSPAATKYFKRVWIFFSNAVVLHGLVRTSVFF